MDELGKFVNLFHLFISWSFVNIIMPNKKINPNNWKILKDEESTRILCQEKKRKFKKILK